MLAIYRDHNWKAWGRLMRIPNLATIPGDILLGSACVLAWADFHPGRFVLLCLISACLYCAGLVLNDIVDYHEDLSERPERPLPSGEISVEQAQACCGLLFGVGICLSAWVGQDFTTLKVALLLVLMILLYNGPARRVPALGFLAMGSCRGLNIVLGASCCLAATGNLLIAAIAETLFVAAICVIAKDETGGLPERHWCMMPFNIAAAACLFLFLSSLGGGRGLPSPSLIAGGLLCLLLFYRCSSLNPRLPVREIPAQVGALVRNIGLLAIVFTIIVNPAYLPAALGALLLFPFAARLSKSFKSS
ncbi:MAG: hypothetical protein RL095_3066 [Verrucomicrobiota bacterium]|jgi:4-hydroxybenzoate polyprenyltransferase